MAKLARFFPSMIDTHTHLNFPDLQADLPAVLARAAAAGVEAMIVPSTGASDSASAVDISAQYPQVYAAIGVHPTDVAEYGDVERAKLKDLLNSQKRIVSIGEVGLDFYRTPKEEVGEAQEKVFREMITLAKEEALPLIIHSRAAFKETYTILQELAVEYPTVIHCFSGTLEEAKAWLAAGYLLSFTGMITYKKNEELREIVRQVPLEKIMIETDAPFLAPEGYRGQTCEPWQVSLVAECIAQVKNISLREVDRATTATAKRFFAIESV